MNTYLHVGTAELSPLLFRNVTAGYSQKPFGGLWLTKWNKDEVYNPWVSYLSEHPHLLFFKDIWDGQSIPCCLINLQDQSHILEIKDDSDLAFLNQHYTPDEEINWSLLSQQFAGIDFSFHNISSNPELGNLLKDFCLDSTILFNLSCIAYYQSGKIIPQGIYGEGCFEDYTFAIDAEKKVISPLPNDYLFLVQNINGFIKDILHQKLITSLTFEQKSKIYQEIATKVENYFQDQIAFLAQEHHVSEIKLTRTLIENALI